MPGSRSCAVGEAFSTSSGAMNARRVIHTVTPRWQDGDSGERTLLAATYRAVLERATADDCISIALPSLGTGANGFPLELAATTAVESIAAYLERSPTTPRLVRIYTARDAAYSAYTTRVDALGGELRAARRTDYWFDRNDDDPVSATRPLRWQRPLDETEAAFVRAGLVPREMEHKWFVYETGSTVHCQRSGPGSRSSRSG